MKAVLFDLDDTLTDRARTLALYGEQFAADFGSLLPEFSAQQIRSVCEDLDGRGYRPREEMFKGLLQLLPWTSRPEISVIEAHWRRWFPALTAARPDMRSTLTALRKAGLRLGVITNGSVSMQSAKMEHLGLERYVSHILISEAVGYAKPDSRIFTAALEQLSVAPPEALFVGDHPVNDVIGARDAGLLAVWLEGIHAWPAEQPVVERRVRALREILDLVF
jgi:putative hydrolase of the HAD superfamily